MIDGSYPGKRAFDRAVLAVICVPAIPIGAACAALVKLTSNGPVFFRQDRVGLGGKPFTVWKFRTMVDREDNPLFPDPERITTVGRWMRRLSLDELPQLINVAVGEMSIVGPRPTLPYQVERYDARQRQRLTVRPGLTGLAQVRGRNSLSWADRIEIDLEYISRQSFWLDLQVLVSTVATVARGSGVGGHPPDDPIAAAGPAS